MGDASAQLAIIHDEDGDGDAHERAYRVWSTIGQRNAAKTAPLLGMPIRTLQDWAQRGHWRARFDHEARERGEDVLALAFAALSELVLPALATIQRALDKDLPSDARPGRDGIIAAMGVLDRFGLGPTRNERVILQASSSSLPRHRLAQVESMSQEQIVDALRELTRGE